MRNGGEIGQDIPSEDPGGVLILVAKSAWFHYTRIR